MPRFPEPLLERISHLPESPGVYRSEEHTSELQSHLNLVCRLLLEKKKFFSPKAGRPLTGQRKKPCSERTKLITCAPRLLRISARLSRSTRSAYLPQRRDQSPPHHM